MNSEFLEHLAEAFGLQSLKETVVPGDRPGVWTHVFTPCSRSMTYIDELAFLADDKIRKALARAEAREKYIARARKRHRRKSRAAFRRQKRGLA